MGLAVRSSGFRVSEVLLLSPKPYIFRPRYLYGKILGLSPKP